MFGSYEPQSLHMLIDFNMLKIAHHVQWSSGQCHGLLIRQNAIIRLGLGWVDYYHYSFWDGWTYFCFGTEEVCSLVFACCFLVVCCLWLSLYASWLRKASTKSCALSTERIECVHGCEWSTRKWEYSGVSWSLPISAHPAIVTWRSR